MPLCLEQDGDPVLNAPVPGHGVGHCNITYELLKCEGNYRIMLPDRRSRDQVAKRVYVLLLY